MRSVHDTRRAVTCQGLQSERPLLVYVERAPRVGPVWPFAAAGQSLNGRCPRVERSNGAFDGVGRVVAQWWVPMGILQHPAPLLPKEMPQPCILTRLRPVRLLQGAAAQNGHRGWTRVYPSAELLRLKASSGLLALRGVLLFDQHR